MSANGSRVDQTFASIMLLAGAALLLLSLVAVAYMAVDRRLDGFVLAAAYGPLGLLATLAGAVGIRARRKPTVRKTLLLILVSAISVAITTGTFFAPTEPPLSPYIGVYNLVLVCGMAIAPPVIHTFAGRGY